MDAPSLEPMTDAERDDPWLGLNPRDPEIRNDPYPAFDRLRRIAPVNRTPWGSYRICRYDDVSRILKGTKVGMRSRDGVLPFTDESNFERAFMLLQDPPRHTRLRRLVSRWFALPTVGLMEPELDALASRLVAEAVERGDGEMDVVRDLAQPLPSTVICKMMGVPLSDREQFAEWTSVATHGLLGERAEPAVQVRALEAAMRLHDYFSRLIDERTRKGDWGDDLVSLLVHEEAEGDALSPVELMSQLIGLLVAGFETTIGLIGNGLRQLILHPDQLMRLRTDPRLVTRAVEECLRVDGPITMTRRVLHEPIEVAGVALAADTIVELQLASAHRDPSAFDRPLEFDVGRDPNPHFAFGGGIHYCLGAHLARLEARAALRAMLGQVTDLELAGTGVTWGPSVFRVPAALPVMFRRA